MANRKYLLIQDEQDLRDFVYASRTVKSPENLPKSVDLRDKMSEIVDQGLLGSCTANAIASGLREYLEIYGNQPFVRLSRLFLYYQERAMENTVNEDSGASLRDGMKVLQKIGVCPEVDQPYIISKFTEAPSEKALTDASQFKIASYHRVPNLTALKTSLYEGFPVVFGMKIYQSFESDQVAATGKIPAPKSTEKYLGGHALLAVGYVNTTHRSGYVIVRNSWGKDWGDQGYCYMPYSVFNKLVTDMWTGQ
ncbi:MAG TPA: C1 family peptidase [Bacillota bacterium]|nr:C1 family peptidase [Bacillota bacterium]